MSRRASGRLYGLDPPPTAFIDAGDTVRTALLQGDFKPSAFNLGGIYAIADNTHFLLFASYSTEKVALALLENKSFMIR